jgi:DNA-binding response OmpR family regulator
MSQTKSNDEPLEKPRLLVVDDEPAMLGILEHLLKRAGCEITLCDSGAKAIDILSAAPFDCVLTDAAMPGMSGYDLVREIRGRLGMTTFPVLMLTRKRHREDLKLAVEVGATDYVFKPIDEALLLEKIETCLRNSGKRRDLRAFARREP